MVSIYNNIKHSFMILLEMQTPELIWSFLKISPLVGAMAIAIWWLTQELKEKEKSVKEKEKEISELHVYIRENDKDNLVVLNNVNATLDKVIETQKSLSERILDNQEHAHDDLIKELGNLKQFIDFKMSQKK